MNQGTLFKSIPCDKYDLLSKTEVVNICKQEEKLRIKFQDENKKLKSLLNMADQKTMLLDEQYIYIKNKLFGKSSEKSEREKKGKKKNKGSKRIQLPSKRYPNIPVIEQDIVLEDIPKCSCCNHKMVDSGMTEDSEELTVIPARFVITRKKRHKYKCKNCHGDIKTTPALKRIVSGSYSDDMVVDVSLSKYLDLIPMERYATIAGRLGVMDLPPQSLIGLSHNLANFVEAAADKCKDETTAAKVLRGDETTHNMLEGDKKSAWFMWGFSSETSCFFDIRNTRSGDVASEYLEKSSCEHFMSDVFSGYVKAIRVTNELRKKYEIPEIVKIYCNAHARRKFTDAVAKDPGDEQFFIKKYKVIYKLDKIAKNAPPDKKLRVRKMMMRYFEAMKKEALRLMYSYPKKSKLRIAMNYFYKNYKEFTLFIDNPILPIDNNSQESLFRSPVVGRKTWHGTHSKRGAKTAAILFTLVQSCKLNKINPRKYFKDLVEDLHAGKEAYTPFEYLTQNR